MAAAGSIPPSTTLYDMHTVPEGVVVAFSQELDADEQGSLIDWLADQHQLRYVQYIIDCDGSEQVLLSNEVPA